MARQAEVKVRIRGDSKEAEAAAKRTETRFQRLANTIKRNLVVSMAAATAAVYGLIRGFKSVIDAANRQEDAVRALDAALIPLGKSAKEVSKRLQEQAAALQQVTKYGDETIIQGQALIASFTKNEEEIKKATQAALDLSAAVGMDLNAAFLLMGKAAAGETSTLTRYGIVLDEGIPKQAKFAAALAKVNEQFGGRAQEAAKTFSGRMSQLSNALGDVAERIGETATKNQGLADTLGRLTSYVKENETAFASLFSTIASGVGQIIGGLVDKLQQLGTAIGAITTKVMDLTGAFDTVEVSESALAATAERLGISVEELRARLEKASAGIHTVNTKTDEAADGMENLVNKIKGAGDEALGLVDNFKNATEAAVGLGNALGEVTSIELALEIDKINEALVESKEKLGANSDEYIRLERIAGEKIEKLQERIRNLRDGLGDLTTTTEEGTDAFDDYSGGLDRASAATDRLTASARANTVALREQASQGQYAKNVLGGQSYFAQIGGGTFTGANAFGTVVQNADGRIQVVYL